MDKLLTQSKTNLGNTSFIMFFVFCKQLLLLGRKPQYHTNKLL